MGKDYGKFINGSYTDIYGLLQSKEVDVSILPCPMITVEDNAFTFGATILDSLAVIHSVTRASTRTDADVVNTFKQFSPQLWMMTCFVVVLCHLTRKLCAASEAVARAYSLLKMVTLLYILFNLLVITVINSSFSTEMTVVDMPEKFNTLVDIVRLGGKPIFHEEEHCHENFINARNDDYRRVWQLIADDKENYVFRNSDISKGSRMFDPFFRGKIAAIGPQFASIFAMITLCMKTANDAAHFVDNGRNYFMSEPLFGIIYGIPQRRGLSYVAVQALRRWEYAFLELAFMAFYHDDMMRNYFIQLNKFETLHCLDTLETARAVKSKQEFEIIKMVNFSVPCKMYLIFMTLASLIIIIEMNM